MLVGLPFEWDKKVVNRAIRQSTLFTVWTVQAVVLFFYTLSGIDKLRVGLIQLMAGEISVFSPYGLGNLSLSRPIGGN